MNGMKLIAPAAAALALALSPAAFADATPAPANTPVASTATKATTTTTVRHSNRHHRAAFTGAALERGAHIKLNTARAAALAARPGKNVDQELEREGGGSGLRYSFDIDSAGTRYEVGIDANSGAVLENQLESAHPD